MWKEFKPIAIFIGKFFLVYIVLTLLYSWYLQPYLYELQTADPITAYTTELSVEFMNFLGFDAFQVQMDGEPYRRFVLDGAYASIVNEGCNAISVLIIFVSFIIAFSNGLIRTSFFLIVSLVLLFITNIMRIGLLNYIFRYHADYTKFAHDYLFPAIIYGMVVMLWLVWVKFFAFKK